MAASSSNTTPSLKKRVRNDKAKRATLKSIKRQKDRQEVFAKAGVAGSYTKSARLALAVTESVGERVEGILVKQAEEQRIHTDGQFVQQRDNIQEDLKTEMDRRWGLLKMLAI